MKLREASTAFSHVRRRLLLASVAGTIAACSPGSESVPRFKGTDITAVEWGRGFDLADHNGRRRTLGDFRGKVVLAFFGYTNCPDACPLALAEMAQLVKQLGPDGNRVQGLFVTVDPERDTPERLKSYVPAFHPSFLGLRGSAVETAQLASEFKIWFRKAGDKSGDHATHGGEHGKYMVDHSTAIFMFDTEGRIRLLHSANGRSVAALVHDVKLLLESGGR